MPYERNPFFTGREDHLQRLEAALSSGNATILTQPQAISGLGGIGKTQTAVEYAYRHQDDYTAVFWIAANTTATLTAGFVEMARLLDLPQAQEADQSLAVEAVKGWLETHDGWLLIVDNADRPELLKPFRPRNLAGRLLLTSRAQLFDILGVVRPIALETMSPAEAVDFLFTRTGRIDHSAEEETAAKELAAELGYLPLALEQAGAYMAANQARFQDYLVSYRQRQLELLEKRTPVVGDYPESVATTWAINFAEVEATSKASADLLRVSAYLSPDSIPLELLTEGGGELSEALSATLANVSANPLILDEVLEPLLRYSLVSRDVESRTYSIHRLVQAVIQAELKKEGQEHLWAERSIRALEAAFTYAGHESWGLCERLISHVEVAARLVERYGFTFMEPTRLLNEAGLYYKDRGQYKAAEPLYLRALSIREEVLGADHPDVANSLNHLALLYAYQGRYSEAEPLYLRALGIYEEVLGADHPAVAHSLNNLAALYYTQGRYTEAEPLYKRALGIYEEVLDADHPDVATSLNNLAALYRNQGRYSEAEPLYLRALGIGEKVLGADHPDVANSLNNLAALYDNQGRYSEAEPLYLRALGIYEEVLGADHPDVATSLNNLAALYDNQGRYSEAEPLYLRALGIREKVLGADHPDVATVLSNLALLYANQGRYSEAEPLYLRALGIYEEVLGADHPDVATSLNNLALLYANQGRYSEAEPLYLRALGIYEEVLGADHPDVATSLNNLALLYANQGRYSEAEPLYLRALGIYEEVLGADHPDVATSLNNLALLYANQGRYSEAEPLYLRALGIYEEVLGADHPAVANSLKNYTDLLRAMGRDAEATEVASRFKAKHKEAG